MRQLSSTNASSGSQTRAVPSSPALAKWLAVGAVGHGVHRPGMVRQHDRVGLRRGRVRDADVPQLDGCSCRDDAASARPGCRRRSSPVAPVGSSASGLEPRVQSDPRAAPSNRRRWPAGLHRVGRPTTVTASLPGSTSGSAPRSRGSQSATVPSLLPVASCVPSALNATLVTSSSWPSSGVGVAARSSVSTRNAVRPRRPTARLAAVGTEGERGHRGVEAAPPSGRQRGSWRSHSRTILSPLPVASHRPSGLNASAVIPASSYPSTSSWWRTTGAAAGVVEVPDPHRSCRS